MYLHIRVLILEAKDIKFKLTINIDYYYLTTNLSIKSGELSILSAYYPIIHTIADLAVTESRVLRFEQISLIIVSYLLGYFLNISRITTIAYWTTKSTFVRIRSSNTWTHLSAILSSLIAHLPIAWTDFLTKNMSTSWE